MPKPPPNLSLEEISKIQYLRKTGHTLSEIRNLTKRANGTIWKYIKDVSILSKYQDVWRAKRGGSKVRSNREWEESRVKASNIIRHIGFVEKMIILSCLYWGEGNKKDLNLINSDPFLIRTTLVCLRDLGIKNKEFKISLRLFGGINKRKAISFWTKILGLQYNTIKKIDVIKGNKVGKLKYGMCRLRVQKGGRYFKLIVSMINLIRLKTIRCPRSSMDRTAHS